MHLRKFILITILLFLGVEMVQATGGSAYSRFGVGERLFTGSVRSMGMGGAGIALRGAGSLNLTNPAVWSDLQVVQFTGSLYYENINFDDGRNTGGIGTGSINGATLAMPVMPSRGVTLTLGFAPMSRVGYNIETTREIENGFQTTKHQGSGGITNLYAGTSYRFNRNLSIGAMALYRMGVLNYEWDNQFSLPGYSPGYTFRELDINGVAGHFGINFSGLLPARQENRPGPLTIGLIFTTPSNLEVDEAKTISYDIGVDTTMTQTGTIELPYSAGIGVSYNIDRRNTVAFDVRYEPWEDFRIFGNPDNQLRNSYRIGAGWEREGRHEIGSGFFERTTFRLGFVYNASYFNIRETPINETLFSFGMGIPLSGIAVLDIGAQYGLRGTTDNNLQQDTIFRIYFSLNLFERWFVPPRIE